MFEYFVRIFFLLRAFCAILQRNHIISKFKLIEISIKTIDLFLSFLDYYIFNFVQHRQDI